MRTRLLLGVMLASVAVAGCRGVGDASTPSKPPSAAEILNKPDQANVKDAHFTMTAHVVSSSVTFDGTGDGLITVKPKQAFHFKMHAAIAGQTLNFEQIIIDGKQYDLAPDNPRWTVKASTNSSNPSSFKGTNAVYLGEETLTQGKAWHVKATDSSGTPFEAWVRESDGYPLKYVSPSQGTTLTLTFDQFNTGQAITAPPASDVQSG